MADQPGTGRRIATNVRLAIKDVLAGTVFVGFGLAFAALAATYEVGTPVRMGPGYFPLLIGVLLVGLGALIAIRGVLAAEAQPIGAVPWRAVILILAAVIVFGLTVRGLGLIPSTVLTVALSALASRRATLIRVVLITAGLTVVSLLVFVIGLSLRLQPIGPWLGL